MAGRSWQLLVKGQGLVNFRVRRWGGVDHGLQLFLYDYANERNGLAVHDNGNPQGFLLI